MEVGIQMIFQSFGYGDDMTDSQVYDEEIELGVLADELGFDALWPVEHHFEDYSFCPDNTVFLGYMAGRTKNIKLGTGAVILPWNEPLRVAEKISLLDQLNGGRTIFGMGRGLSRREYEGFGLDMDTSRDRFDEASAMILEALESGTIEGDGPYYPQPRTPIRPAPTRTFKGRTSAVAMSPDSVEQAARLGVKMVIFTQKAWPEQEAIFEGYRSTFREVHNSEPPPPVICDFTYCHADPAVVKERAHEYITGYLASILHHYELASDHYKGTKGYEEYASNVDAIRAMGLERMAKAYLRVQAWGAPEQILDRLEERRKIVGDYDLVLCFRYAGMPFDQAEASMRLFAAEVLPVLHGWQAADGSLKPEDETADHQAHSDKDPALAEGVGQVADG